MAKTSDAMLKAINKYQKEKCDEIKIRVQKGKKEVLQDIAVKQGKSLNGYIKEAVTGKIKADTGEEIDL